VQEPLTARAAGGRVDTEEPSAELTTPRARTARGARTREALLDAAERLWGARGIDGVSLREIRIAAGQRNSSALQVHFGDRTGLRRALAQRHVPRIAAIQENLYEVVLAAGREHDLAALIETMVRPPAEYLRRGPSERAWTMVAAEELSRPELLHSDLAAGAPPVARHVGTAVHARLAQTMPPDLAAERLLAVIVAVHHLCADRARYEETRHATVVRAALPFDRWLDNLLDMAVAAMTAPSRTASPRPRPVL
jgi:AcrR family transcriptional regulator